MIPIFMATDNNYAPYLIVVIKSVCENTKSNLIFYILVKDIDQIFKDKIIEMVSQYKNCNVEFININKHNIFSECHNRNYISKAAYYRLLIPNLKPQTDKAVYLDADLIVNIDISELFNQELGDYIIGAAYEECNKQYHSLVTKRSLGIDMKHNYFNSGVLLINCKKWRENNLTQKLKDTYDICKDRMIFHDQDLLNKFFSVNNYFPLDEKFNYFIQNKPTEARNLIFHYDGILKPWQFSQSLNTEIINYIDIWWDYAKETNCFDIIKDKCIYKDALSLRVARAIRAKHLLYKNQLNEKFEQISPV